MRKPNHVTVLALTLILGFAVLSGCTPGSPTKAGKGAQITLTIFNSGAFPSSALSVAIKEYTSKNPSVKIETRTGTLLSGNGTLDPAAANGIDLYFASSKLMNQLQGMGTLADLTSMNVPNLSAAAAPIFQDAGVAEGRRYGVPLMMVPAMLELRPDSFTQAGISLPAANWDLTEFQVTLKRLKTAGVPVNLPLAAILDPVLHAFGGQLWDSTTQAWAFDTPAAKQGLTYLAGLVQSGLISLDYAESATDVALQVYGTNPVFGGQLQPFPTGPAGRSVYVTSFMGAVNRTAPHPEVALNFLRSLVSDGPTERLLAQEGIRPETNDSQALQVWKNAIGSSASEVWDLSLNSAHSQDSVNTNEVITALKPYLDGSSPNLDGVVADAMAHLPH